MRIQSPRIESERLNARGSPGAPSSPSSSSRSAGGSGRRESRKRHIRKNVKMSEAETFPISKLNASD